MVTDDADSNRDSDLKIIIGIGWSDDAGQEWKKLFLPVKCLLTCKFRGHCFIGHHFLCTSQNIANGATNGRYLQQSAVKDQEMNSPSLFNSSFLICWQEEVQWLAWRARQSLIRNFKAQSLCQGWRADYIHNPECSLCWLPTACNSHQLVTRNCTNTLQQGSNDTQPWHTQPWQFTTVRMDVIFETSKQIKRNLMSQM